MTTVAQDEKNRTLNANIPTWVEVILNMNTKCPECHGVMIIIPHGLITLGYCPICRKQYMSAMLCSTCKEAYPSHVKHECSKTTEEFVMEETDNGKGNSNS